jgi:hypothetical protein
MPTCNTLLSHRSILALSALLVSGCSGGGGGASPVVPDTTAPLVEVLFPQAGCLVAGPYVTVRGTCSDASTIVSVSVNGIEASSTNDDEGTSSDDFENWEVEMPVASGLNDYVVSASDSEGNSDNGAASVSVECSGFIWGYPVKMDLDTATGRLYVLDSMLDSIVEVDLESGHRTLLTGPPADGYFGMSYRSQDLAFDATFNRALLVDAGWAGQKVVIGVDLITGQRTLLSGNGVGAGPALTNMYNVCVSADGLTAYLAVDDTLLSVDLTSGDRAVVSDSSTGTGPTFSFCWGTHLDEGKNRILIADPAQNQLFAVDLTSGDRTLLSDETVGTGDSIINPVDVGYDPIADHAYLVEDGYSSSDPGLMEVDLATGEQTLISDDTTGSGTLLDRPKGAAWDPLGNRALVLDSTRNVLVAVDAVSGDRSSITDISVGSGSGRVGYGAIAHDPLNQRLICVDDNVLLAVDLVTGDRSVWMDGSMFPSGTYYNLAYSPMSGKAYFNHEDTPAIYVFDPVAGTVDVLSALGSTEGMVVDDAAGALLAIQDDSLVSIDMTTGAITTISGGTSGSGPGFSSLWSGLAVNADRTVAWTQDSDLEAVFRVDLATGARTIVSDPSTGTGDTLENIFGLVVDEALGKAYLVRSRTTGTSDDPNGVVIVDLATGDRTLMYQDSATSRSPLTAPRSIVRDEDTGLLYLGDILMEAIVVVDPITGCNGVRSAAQ